MAQKVLFQTGLSALSTTDEEGIGNLRYEMNGRVYRYVKNQSATALVRGGSCLKALTDNLANHGLKVISPDFEAATTGTASMYVAGGVPVTAIGASGASAFGFVQVAGLARVSMLTSDSTKAISGWPGYMSIATGLIATAGWDSSPAVGAQYNNGVMLTAKFKSGSVAYGRSASVNVFCL